MSNMARVIAMKDEYIVIHPEVESSIRQFEYQQVTTCLYLSCKPLYHIVVFQEMLYLWEFIIKQGATFPQVKLRLTCLRPRHRVIRGFYHHKIINLTTR